MIGRCCHSSASDCSGSKGVVVTELSLSFCADELLLSGECVWIVNECLSQTKVAELLDDLTTDKLRVLQSQARNAWGFDQQMTASSLLRSFFCLIRRINKIKVQFYDLLV